MKQIAVILLTISIISLLFGMGYTIGENNGYRTGWNDGVVDAQQRYEMSGQFYYEESK